MTTAPKRLIEVDLPIARISAQARRAKSSRHAHNATLHIWWARLRAAVCRAVIREVPQPGASIRSPVELSASECWMPVEGTKLL